MIIGFTGTTKFNPTLFGELEDYGKKHNWRNQKKSVYPRTVTVESIPNSV